MTVTVIGLGPMGQALTGALLDAGHAVTVWNRTPGRAAGILARGAHWAATPADAVQVGELTLINVVDNAAVDAIVAQAGPAVTGQVIVGLSSDTPHRVRRSAQGVALLGGHYLDGAIMTPIDTIGTRDASILFAGPRALYDTHHAVFDALGVGTWLGENPAVAAGYDMALLDMFWSATSGYLHALELAEATGISATDFLPHALGIVGILPAIFTDAAHRVDDDRHDDATSSLSAFGRHVEAATDAGHGEHEVTAITQRAH